MKSLNQIQDQEYRATLIKKLAPPLGALHFEDVCVCVCVCVRVRVRACACLSARFPLLMSKLFLVTLLSSEPEVQYVALRNINLIVQKHPNILAQHMKVSE